jgi:hypothetical protein
MFAFLCHILNYIQQNREKHKNFNYSYSNFIQQLTRAFFSVAHVDYILSKCLSGDYLLPVSVVPNTVSLAFPQFTYTLFVQFFLS